MQFNFSAHSITKHFLEKDSPFKKMAQKKPTCFTNRLIKYEVKTILQS